MDDAVVHDLKEEILYLRSLLDANGIKYDFEAYCLEKDARKTESPMIPIDITPETAKFFFSMFHGMVDVYAKRSKNGTAEMTEVYDYYACSNY